MKNEIVSSIVNINIVPNNRNRDSDSIRKKKYTIAAINSITNPDFIYGPKM